MCGLCGLLGPGAHWSEAPDIADGNRTGPAERHHRAASANRVLALFGLKLSVWQTRYVLVNRTGRSVVIDSLGQLWVEAERLSGRACDPLDPVLIAALER